MNRHERAAIQFTYELFSKIKFASYIKEIYVGKFRPPWVIVKLKESPTLINACINKILTTNSFSQLFDHCIIYMTCTANNQYRCNFHVHIYTDYGENHRNLSNFHLTLYVRDVLLQKEINRHRESGCSIMQVKQLSPDDHLDVYRDSFIAYFLCLLRTNIIVPKDLRRLIWDLVKNSKTNFGEIHFDSLLIQPWESQKRKRRKIK